MFGIYGVNGPQFRGRLEQLPEVRPVGRKQPVEAIGTDGAELSNPESREAAIASYQRILHNDRERGPLVHAHQIMRREVVVLRASDDVAAAWRTLVKHQIHQAPVLDGNGQLVGVVSERDLLTALNIDQGEIRDALSRKVADVMSTPVVAAEPDTDIRLLARVMLERSVDGVPIVDAHNALTGFVSRGDVLRAVVTEPQLSLWR